MLTFHFRWDVCFALYFVYVCLYEVVHARLLRVGGSVYC